MPSFALTRSRSAAWVSSLPTQAKTFGRQWATHLKTHWFAYLLAVVCVEMLSANYTLGINATPSLPQKLFVIHKHAPVRLGDYAAFKPPPEAGFDSRAILTKIVAGVEGDHVVQQDRMVFVNGVPVGYAKERSLKGAPLEPVRSAVIGRNEIYVRGLHKDSLDSRYAMVGLLTPDRMIGRAYPLW